MVLSDSVVVFVVSLLIGAFGIHVGALVVTDADDFAEALLAALVGALAWAVVGAVAGDLPEVGSLVAPVLALFAYVAVIKWRYGSTWLRAGAVAVIAWVIALGVLTALGELGVRGLDAVGVPKWGELLPE